MARAAPRAAAAALLLLQCASLAGAQFLGEVVGASHAHHAAAAAGAHHSHRRGPWRRPVVIVVTWHNASIDWLAALPPARVQVALYIKGNARTCADVPAAVRPLVAFCEILLNAGGREAHTMAAFALQFYDALPRVMFFAHDDCTRADITSAADPRIGGESHSCGALRFALWDRPATHAWVAAREASPGDAFADQDSCLCNLVVENFKPCPLGPVVVGPLVNGVAPCYGEGYLPMMWAASTLLDLNNSGWEHIRWPSRAQLAVTAAAVQARPRLLYRLLVELLSADLVAPDSARTGQEGPGGAAALRRAEETPVLLHAFSPEPIGRRWSSLQWAHTFERLWFMVFDAEYSPYKYGPLVVNR